jgi:hypothetical protein
MVEFVETLRFESHSLRQSLVLVLYYAIFGVDETWRGTGLHVLAKEKPNGSFLSISLFMDSLMQQG